jgi:hypothetical protein
MIKPILFVICPPHPSFGTRVILSGQTRPADAPAHSLEITLLTASEAWPAGVKPSIWQGPHPLTVSEVEEISRMFTIADALLRMNELYPTSGLEAAVRCVLSCYRHVEEAK